MTSNTTSDQDRESDDADSVNAAVEALMTGDVRKAESLLLRVIATTPPNYKNSFDDEQGISIKFWDQIEFVHFITWQQEHGQASKDKSIQWLGNAYPRAHYYMGYICVKQKKFERAIEFLDKGLALEPTNPKFIFEKAQALIHSGRLSEGMELYEQVNEIGPHVCARDLAVAQRGKGFVLIELGQLDDAEAAFRASLKHEPDNEIARNELLYIEHLRQGGAATFAEAVSSSSPDVSRCAVCGNEFTKGVVVSLDGMPVSICRRCENKLTKKWWQFWR